jgi:hypothetical protein
VGSTPSVGTISQFFKRVKQQTTFASCIGLLCKLLSEFSRLQKTGLIFFGFSNISHFFRKIFSGTRTAKRNAEDGI